MLNELAPHLGGAKGLGLVRRLNNDKDVTQALPAEMELALLWAIGRLGDIDIEPESWPDSRRPDAVTSNLTPGRDIAIEIASVADNSISGEEAMDAIALQISAAANSARKKTGDYLYFRFAEESGNTRAGYYRRRLAPTDFKLPPQMTEAVRAWIASGQSLASRLRLRAPGLDVEVEHTNHKQTRYHNIWSSMPPEVHSLEDNPLFELLVRKSRQLRRANTNMGRMIFLADVGNTLLRRVGQVGELDQTKRFVSAREIILNFLQKRAPHIDGIAIFSPFKEHTPFLGMDLSGRKPRRWNVTYFGLLSLPSNNRLQEVVDCLPEPRYEGYQARSLFRQGAFSPKGKGEYLGMMIRTDRQGRNRIDFPARMLLDLLAGRLSPEHFHHRLGNDVGKNNIFKHWLDMGMTISDAEMAPRNIDEDDDHLILHFSDDPAARPLTLPGTPPAHSDDVGRSSKAGEESDPDGE